MITFRPYDDAEDYAMLQTWWRGHKQIIDVPRNILPDGFVAVCDGVDMAASFLYCYPGKVAAIEWTVTNPVCSASREIVLAVRGLYEHLEKVAREANCAGVFSFVNPNSWERRTMGKMGYHTSADAIPHLMFVKSFTGGLI